MAIDGSLRVQKIKQNMIFEDGAALYPARCIFYVTLLCNLHCKMCFQKKHNRRTEELTLDEIRRIFSKIKLSSILLVGGEIFVRPDIYEIIEYFNSSINHISIQTNGTLISNEGIKRLNGFKNVKDIWISVDGLKDTHNSIRGKGAFEKVLKVIEKLRLHKKIIINTVILEDNIEQLLDIYRYFDDFGVHQVTFQFQMVYTRGQYKKTHEKVLLSKYGINMQDDCVVNKANLEYAMQLKYKISELLKHENKARIRFYPEIFVDNVENYVNGDILKKYKVICRDIVEPVLKIGSSGELLLCEALKYSPGNLKNTTLDDLWNCDEMRNLRKNLSEANLVDLCSRCCCLDLI